MLRKLLAGSKIEREGFGEGRERGYRFRGELSIGRLITGAATNTSHWRGPNGKRPCVEARNRRLRAAHGVVARADCSGTCCHRLKRTTCLQPSIADQFLGEVW
jgi:hypothetical protein